MTNTEPSLPALHPVVFCPCGAPGMYRERDNTSPASHRRIPEAAFRCGTALTDPATDIWWGSRLTWLENRRSTTVSWACRRISEWKSHCRRLEAAA